MPLQKPSPTQWTLKFKLHKTTLLLLVAPSQSFSSIKEDLLEMLQARNAQEINGHIVPTDPENLVFGLPVDKNDISKGWIALEVPEVEDIDVAKGKGVKKGSVLNQNPLGAGLQDHATLAFKFKEAGAGDDTTMDTDFDVIMPSYEDDESQGRS